MSCRQGIHRSVSLSNRPFWLVSTKSKSRISWSNRLDRLNCYEHLPNEKEKVLYSQKGPYHTGHYEKTPANIFSLDPNEHPPRKVHVCRHRLLENFHNRFHTLLQSQKSISRLQSYIFSRSFVGHPSKMLEWRKNLKSSNLKDFHCPTNPIERVERCQKERNLIWNYLTLKNVSLANKSSI